MTLEQLERIIRAARANVNYFTDPNPRMVMKDALDGALEEIRRMKQEEAH